MLLLGACAQGVSKPISPDVVQYPQTVMDQAADEMESGQCETLTDTMMPDYKVMRDQSRAIKKR